MTYLVSHLLIICFSLVLHALDFRCLAHIINLATQSLILTCSKAKYYSADAEDVHIPDLAAFEWDKIGLVWAVTIKVHSQTQYNLHAH